MNEETADNAAVETPYTLRQLNSQNHATIEKDQIEFVEQKKLGLSRFVIQIKDISSCKITPGEEGDEVLVQRWIGNPMRIGPVDPEAAKTAVALIESLRS